MSRRPKRLLADFKEDSNGDIVGRLDLPADSAFALEVLAEVIRRFSINCEVPVDEILKDIGRLA